MSADQGRIVVVAAGFALWTGGRCVAAARYSDIQRLRVMRPAGAAAVALALRVELTDGSIMELRGEAPGFDQFVDRARTSLKGMSPVDQWHSALAAGAVPAEGLLIFEKPKGW